MAYIVVTGSFPSHVGKEVGKTFLKLEKLPDFVKTEHVFNTAAGDYMFFSIYQIEDETKYFDGLKAITKRFSGYMDIKGYKYTLHPVLEAKDALSMIGLG
ncbi:MAG: hypothetical protein ACXACC_01380 [Promethearchaeota archaeon]|jgi:hypothetical protein